MERPHRGGRPEEVLVVRCDTLHRVRRRYDRRRAGTPSLRAALDRRGYCPSRNEEDRRGVRRQIAWPSDREIARIRNDELGTRARARVARRGRRRYRRGRTRRTREERLVGFAK